MNKFQKISKFKLLLFMIVTSLFYIIGLSFDLIISTSCGASYLIGIFSILFLLIITIFLPKHLKLPFKTISNNIVRIIYKISIIVQSICIIVFSSSFIQTYFNIKSSLLIFIIIFLISTFFVSRSSLKNIVNTSFLFCLVSVISYIIPLTNNCERSFVYLELFQNNFHYIIIFSLLITSYITDYIIISFYQNQVSSPLSKSDFLLYGLITISIVSFIIFDSTTIISYKYYEGINNASFFHWMLYKGNKYINNFDILVFIIMITSVFFKITFNFNFLNVLSKKSFISSNYFNIIIIFIFSGFIYYNRSYYYLSNIILNIINVIFSITIVTLTIILFKTNKEIGGNT